MEVAPLAFMRGRTLNDAFVILDEAQNTTVEQMKMFLTRLGFHSKAVVTGDVTQVDLPQGRLSGLSHARRILEGVEGIAFCTFSEVDVVRHPLVQEVIRAYERADAESKVEAGPGGDVDGGAAARRRPELTTRAPRAARPGNGTWVPGAGRGDERHRPFDSATASPSPVDRWHALR